MKSLKSYLRGSLALILILLVMNLASGDTIFEEEDFEGTFPPSGWSRHNGEPEHTKWELDIDDGRGDSYAASHTYTDEEDPDDDDWLITPGINLSGYSNQQLIYWEKVIYPDDAYNQYVKISTNYSGDPATATWDILREDTPTVEDTYEQRSIDISAYSGTVYIAFHYASTYAAEWYIDEVSVTGDVAATVTFTDGSSFTPSITLGSSNQAIGRFNLAGSASGATLTEAVIELNGTRTGLSNLWLWSSTDETFESGSDLQLYGPESDPGDGNPVTFSGFSSSIATSGGTYYFLTGDVASEATGVVQGVIVQNSNLTISGGTLSGSIDNDVLSNGDASLPVELTFFTAESQSNGVLLTWRTESESENLGFIIGKRQTANGEWTEIASYTSNESLEGQGSISSATDYSYTDTQVQSGVTYLYRLGDVDYSGTLTWHASVEVTVPESGAAVPNEFGLHKAYPNPFNPLVNLSYTLTDDGQTTLSIYNLRGQLVETLVSTYQPNGSYSVTWQPRNLSAGVYIVRLESGSKTNLQRVVFVK